MVTRPTVWLNKAQRWSGIQICHQNCLLLLQSICKCSCVVVCSHLVCEVLFFFLFVSCSEDRGGGKFTSMFSWVWKKQESAVFRQKLTLNMKNADAALALSPWWAVQALSACLPVCFLILCVWEYISVR